MNARTRIDSLFTMFEFPIEHKGCQMLRCTPFEFDSKESRYSLFALASLESSVENKHCKGYLESLLLRLVMLALGACQEARSGQVSFTCSRGT